MQVGSNAVSKYRQRKYISVIVKPTKPGYIQTLDTKEEEEAAAAPKLIVGRYINIKTMLCEVNTW